MATNISSLDLSARIGPYKYIFIIVHGDPFLSAVREELAKQFAPFGEALGDKGAVFAPFESKVASTNEEFYDKAWPEEIEDEIFDRLLSGDGGDPAVLVINTDFATFNPMTDPWRIIWLSDYQDSPQDIVRLFRLLAAAANRDEDVMDYLGSLARAESLRNLSKVVDIKPGIFGISVDLKALLSQALALRH
jgi:hypothetical protein